MHKKGTVPCVCLCRAGGLGLVAFETAAFGALKWVGGGGGGGGGCGGQAKNIGLKGVN